MWIGSLTRSQRVSAAVVLALLVSILATALTDTASVSAVRTGDFPAFYTLAVIADSPDSSRLYEQSLQQAIQASVWPGHLTHALLPAAYPPYVAAIVRPLAWLGPEVGRFVWLAASVFACLAAILLCVRLRPELAARKIEVMAAALSFAPLLVGVIGGQVVAFSAVVYVAMLLLCKKEGSWSASTEFLFGALVGAWLFKPQYALVALVPLIVKRRWKALGGTALIAALCYVIGAAIMGFGWLPEWLAFARQFAEMNFASNSYQMTNFVAGVRQLQSLNVVDGSLAAGLKYGAVAVSALMLGGWAFQAARKTSDLFSTYLVLPSLLVLATPQANFYDLGLSVFPVLFLYSFFVPRERNLLVVVWVLTAVASLCRYPDSLPWFVVLALVVHVSIYRQSEKCVMQ